MLFDAAIVTILVGAGWLLILRLKRGSFPASIGRLDLRLPLLFAFAFMLQLALAALSIKQVGLARAAFPAVHILSYLLLLYAAGRNWGLFGMKIAAFGIALNFLVVAANLGHMPADLSLLRRSGGEQLVASVQKGNFPRHQLVTSQTRLPFLADVHLLPRPYPRPCVFSLGDIFITLGACWLILTAMGLLPADFRSRSSKR